jgi:hypothetical protein
MEHNYSIIASKSISKRTENRMKTRKGIILLGCVTIFLWVSYTPNFIPLPFSLQPSVKKIAKNLADASESIKEKAGFGGKSQAEIERGLMKKVILIWLIKAVPILIGLFSGLFLIRRKNYGRVMAVLVAISWILLNSIIYVNSGNIRDRLYATYVTLFRKDPVFVIHNDILPVIIFLFTIFYLMRPTIAREFKDSKRGR